MARCLYGDPRRGGHVPRKVGKESPLEEQCLINTATDTTAKLPNYMKLRFEFYFYKIVLDLWQYVHVYL